MSSPAQIDHHIDAPCPPGFPPLPINVHPCARPTPPLPPGAPILARLPTTQPGGPHVEMPRLPGPILPPLPSHIRPLQPPASVPVIAESYTNLESAASMSAGAG